MPSNHDDDGPVLVFGVEYYPAVPKAIYLPSDSISSLDPPQDLTSRSEDVTIEQVPGRDKAERKGQGWCRPGKLLKRFRK